MTVEQLIAKLQHFPSDMPVKIVNVTVDDVLAVAQDGDDYVKLIADGGGNVKVFTQE